MNRVAKIYDYTEAFRLLTEIERALRTAGKGFDARARETVRRWARSSLRYAIGLPPGERREAEYERFVAATKTFVGRLDDIAARRARRERAS